MATIQLEVVSPDHVVYTANIAMLTGSGFVGQGTHVATIERMSERSVFRNWRSARVFLLEQLDA